MHAIESLIKSMGRKCSLAFIAAIFAAMFTFAAPAQQAQAGEFEFGAAFGYAGNVDDKEDNQNGFTFTLDFGYMIKDWVGVFVEQDLGAMFYGHDDDIAAFYGATMFEGKFVYGLSRFELFGKVGIGAVYMDCDDHNAKWDNAWFGLRLGIGGTYMLSSNMGLGLNFDYTPSFDNDHVDHFLRFQLHFLYRF